MYVEHTSYICAVQQRSSIYPEAFAKSFKHKFGREKGWRCIYASRPWFYNIIISYNAMVLVVERFYVQYLVESLPKNPYNFTIEGWIVKRVDATI